MSSTVNTDFFTFAPDADFLAITSDAEKIKAVFSNPAVLRVFKLQCDMFSQGKFYVYKDGESVESDPFLDMMNKPNFFQNKRQWLWDFMFWKMLGNAYCYCYSNVPSKDNTMYFLDNSKMTLSTELLAYKDRFVQAKATRKLIDDLTVTYTHANGTTEKIKWGKITHLTDLTNGVGNWFKGPSAVDALHQIITNSNESTASKNVVIRMMRKFMVAGKADPDNVSVSPLSNMEKRDIETKMNGLKNIHAFKSMIDVKRFVERVDIAEKLDASFRDDFIKVGGHYNIPREVLDAAFEGSTYENQEKARGAHIDYNMMPAGEDLCSGLDNRFLYSENGKTILLSWDHLSFTQVFEKERAEVVKLKAETLLLLMKAGVKKEEINQMLDLEITDLDYEPAKRSNTTNSNGETGAGQK